MPKECIGATAAASGYQTAEINGKKGIVSFGRDMSEFGEAKNPAAPCVIAEWFNPENYKRVKVPNIRDCLRCGRGVGFKPIKG